ncbi:manganese peroxidase 2 [Cristinia sonorae]|uniref:Peroxidase n=1 Tax=Cristinia sonorae TaxID=1940300 RepID=A0A8K0XM48_9AGAR|nr:manganese peroxidase 2 [Cristinia sonorae]
MNPLILTLLHSFFLLLSSQHAALAAPNTRLVRCSKDRFARDDACCVWYDVLDDVQENLFDRGKCGAEARESLRIMFHDAIGYSESAIKAGKFGGGGADGSMMAHADVELEFKGNIGMDEIINEQRPFALKHHVPFGDFIQFAGAVGLSNCHGAPRLQFLAGRSNHSRPAPDEGLIPAPFHTADQIFARMKDAGFSPEEVVALSAAHSVGAQHQLDPSINNAPLDSTPEEFDSQFFLETLLEGTHYPGDSSALAEDKSPLRGQFRIHSDGLLARDHRSACEWQSFITDQDGMNRKFARVMAKVSLLGQDPSKLVDCSEVIPDVRPARRQRAVLPAGKTRKDVEANCVESSFPSLNTQPGPPTFIRPAPSRPT